MFDKILIANRGEIARRIISTCRRLGIRTVAVFSDADRDALHVRSADEAVHIGSSDASTSYLDANAIMSAAATTGATAVHPGYGFLSERVVLAELCASHRVTWIGPSVEAIARMGSKIESKRIARRAGVVETPGYHGEDQSDDVLTAAAESIGYPVLIKASAGGGGRGMRRVDRREDFAGALRAARSEAQSSFGDGDVLIEKLIRRPRHLEVQLIGDKHENLAHLFERECSIQRNYQKLVEEAPAPRLSEQTRAKLFGAALRLGKAINYDSAGTVEFILEEGEEQPYFLEMNTRLQVEHPVTELVTGLDLVELQIRSAAGLPLPFSQGDLTCRGSAIEARVNAEDPAQRYMPCTGRITGLSLPASPDVRIDIGVMAGSEITPHYDSMIGKVIAYGPSRESAANRLSAALDDVTIFGVGTNLQFLRDIVRHPQFRHGALTTRFIEEAFPTGWRWPAGDALDLVAFAAIWARRAESRENLFCLGPFLSLGSFRILDAASGAGYATFDLTIDGETTAVKVSGRRGSYRIKIADAVYSVTIDGDAKDVMITINGVARRCVVDVAGDLVSVSTSGRNLACMVAGVFDRAGAAAEDKQLGSQVVASMPGLISSIEVATGEQVVQGQTIVVLEAMKLMNNLSAPISGTIREIFCVMGQAVSTGAILATIEPLTVEREAS